MTEILEQLSFWNKLSEDERTLCKTSAVVREYESGSYLLGECGSKACLGMIRVLSGEIRAFILSEGGREITLFRLGPGDNCVLSASCVLSQITFETQLYVTRDAQVLVIPSAAYGKLMDSNIYVRCFTYELTTERFSAVMWVMHQIIFYGFDKRLANFLVSEYERSGSREIRMTQEEIAVATNSAREVVARMIKQFAGDGLLDSRRGVITLKDINGLKKLM